MTTTPNNLPRLQPFFGRTAELRQIHDALSPDARTWGALIDGPGGMGKTSLAIRAAQECPPGMFDRIIFVSVKDWEMEDDGLRVINTRLMSGLHELFTELARELGLIEFGKSAETERVRLLLDALRPLKALLILDNLESLAKEDRDPLFTFIKRLPGGCKAILTSRRRLAAGAEMLILERLDQDAALATLAELAKHNKLLAKTSEAERIVLHAHTGGNPLLLRWTAGQLGRGSCRTFTDALAYLRSCPEGNDPLEFVFGDLAREFTDGETKVLAALTYFTQPATVEHIATVAGAAPGSSRREEAPANPEASQSLLTSSPTGSEDGATSAQPPTSSSGSSRRKEAPSNPADSQSLLTSAATGSVFDLAAVETALRTLANRSLVVPDQEERAYTLVPMVADFLRKKRPEVVAATGQHLEQRAFDLIEENGYRKHDRFAILDAAWPMVAPAIPLFLAGSYPRLQNVCRGLLTFLEFTGRWTERHMLKLHADRTCLFGLVMDNVDIASYRYGCLWYFNAEGDKILDWATKAETHLGSVNAGARERAVVKSLRGIGFGLKRDYQAALANASAAVELWRSWSGRSEELAIGLSDVAALELEMKDYAAAERDYREALRIANVVGSAEAVALYTSNLAALALAREDWPGAETLAREALTLSEVVNRTELIAEDNRRLAEALVRQGKTEEALPYATKSVELYTCLRSPDLVAAQATLQKCQP